MEKVLLDTDIGGDIDDAVCLAYLLREPRCELIGITTVCGQSERRAAVADALCRAAGRRVPIVAGMDRPLQPIPVYPTPEGAAALDSWAHDVFDKGDAPAFLAQKIRENPHAVTLIAIGNMTNIAACFRDYPDVPALLKGFQVMNGYFGKEPLPDAYWNWNSWADPLASKAAFAACVRTHRAIPLEVTDQLTIEAARAGELLPADSELMRAVFDFGQAWLTSSHQLTLHDPLAAVTVFYPEICRYEKGFVAVETKEKTHMGGTTFVPDEGGNVEIARSVDRERFYAILSSTLKAKVGESALAVPEAVVKRANAAGEEGRAWLRALPGMIAELEERWRITAGAPMAGGTHAYVALARQADGSDAVLKIDMPSTYAAGEFMKGIRVLQIAQGHGYARLLAWDEDKKACLMERLGRQVKQLGLPVRQQIAAVCAVLEASWKTPVRDTGDLTDGDESIAWFRTFIREEWEAQNHPCTEAVIDRAMHFLQEREAAKNPAEYVFVHGDAHGANVLEDLSREGAFKLIDADGLFYEKAYDLGVLMREWTEEYREHPVEAGRARCRYLHELTGVKEREIWAWGFLQSVSTGMVLLRVGQRAAGEAMLATAQAWAAADEAYMARPEAETKPMP